MTTTERLPLLRNKFVIGIVAAVVTIAVAYLAGSLPERGLRVSAETRVEQLAAQLDALQARMRGADLLGQALWLKEVATRGDYGQAQQVSSPFFDRVREESATTPNADLKLALAEVLKRRDAVTVGLARGDASTVAALHEVEKQLRAALGFTIESQASTGR